MNTESEDYKKMMLKRARITATTFGVLAVITLISLVYAFIQQEKATKSIENYKQEALQFRERAEKAEEALGIAKREIEFALGKLDQTMKEKQALIEKTQSNKK